MQPTIRIPTRWLRQAAVYGVMTLAALSAAGAACAASDGAFQAAFQSFVQAQSGDAGAVDKSADAFADMLKAEPANPVLMVYAGASTAMKASTTSLPWKKMSYAEDGLAQVDKALAMLTPAHDAPIQRGTPGALEVRFVAANTYLAMPSFMNRGERGAKLLNDVIASPLFDKAPLPFKGNVWMRAGKLAEQQARKDDAKRWFQQVVDQAAPQAEAARAKLKEAA